MRQALGIAFDVVVNNEIALRNSLLIAAYASEPRARKLMLIVKVSRIHCYAYSMLADGLCLRLGRNLSN